GDLCVPTVTEVPEQPSPFFRLPSSQTSPTSRMPLPHSSFDLQSALQPSPPLVLPSSQTSPGSMTPLPHTSRLHCDEQVSPSMMLPSSHSSPGSTTPLPHRVGRQTFCTAAQCISAGQ